MARILGRIALKTSVSRTAFGLLLASTAQPALAQCVPAGPSLVAGTTVSCSGTQLTRLGQGPGADNVTVHVNDGATISTNNANAISLGNNAQIYVGSQNGTATATVATTSTGGGGQYGTGNNTIEFNNNSTVIIYKNGVVSASGTQNNSEAINPYGAGNTILNYGTIQGGPSSAIFFENINTSASSPRNVVDNYGLITLIGPGNNPTTQGQAVGSFGNVGIDFINETGAVVNGNLDLQGGNDNVTLNPGSKINGNLNGGGGFNTLTLNASTSLTDYFSGQVNNFSVLNKTGPGAWTLTGSISDNGGQVPLTVNVIGGTLVIEGNNANFNGSIVINPDPGGNLSVPGPDPSATLAGRAQSMPPLITDHGVLAFTQDVAGTYSGVIQGTGVVEKVLPGVLTLTGVNTYTGGTFFYGGFIAVGADSALGAATGPLTFNGGGLQFLSAFNLSPNRQITLQGGGGTLDVNGFQTTVSQSMSGPGGLTVMDSAGGGALILTGDNVYSGGTAINAATLQIGNGGTTGSIVGDVADNGALVFDRSNDISFGGAISGSGSVTQMGTGTLTLSGASSYTGGTFFKAGFIAVGADSALGAPTGALTFSGGGLRLLDSFDLSPDRAITLKFQGGTIDSNGFQTTVSQPITGLGGLTVQSSVEGGAVILNGVSTYFGLTTVRSGTLAIGDPDHQSAALAGGAPVTVEGGGTFGGYGSVAGSVVNLGRVAVADAVPAFEGGPTGTFSINGNFLNDGEAQIAGSSIGNVLAVKGDYAGTQNATVNIRTYLNAGGPLSNQFTDRLLITGNAVGTTIVNVTGLGSGAYTSTGTHSATDGISIIQVAGDPSPNTFVVPGGYVDGGTPFQYGLYAYGPGSPNGPASQSQQVVAGSSLTWDYRLESIFVGPDGPVEPPAPGQPDQPDERPAVAPQIPSYLSLPTALFNAGLQDLDSLHRRLGEIRDDPGVGRPEDGEVFVRSYGDASRYTTDRSFSQFGYNSTQDYGAVQVGVNAIVRHDLNGTLRAGLFGTVGELWLQPYAVDGSSSGRFNTYSLAGALTWQSGAGWYVDAIVSGGANYGDITTALKGRAANSASTAWSASIETGYPIALGWQGLALEPELQLIGQRLDFAPFADTDGIAANLGSQSQGVFRAGARLLKAFASTDSGVFTAYLKANVLQGLGGGGTVELAGYSFHTGTYGTAVQVGGGVNGALSKNLSAYGDVAWQNNVSTGGFRGWAFNGGVRYAF